MEKNIESFHDKAITGIHFFQNLNQLVINLAKGKLIFDDVKDWQFSPFDTQNIIFEVQLFEITTVPEHLLKEFLWVNHYNSDTHLKVVHIASSVGLSGLVISKKVTIKRDEF